MSKEPRSEVVSGITIVSRHGIERELVRMRKSVAGLPKRLRSDVTEIFCDSKAGSHYVISLRSPESASAVASSLPPLWSSLLFVCGGRRVHEVRV